MFAVTVEFYLQFLHLKDIYLEFMVSWIAQFQISFEKS